MARLIIGIFIIFIGLSALTGFPVFNTLVPLIIILIGVRILIGRSYGLHCCHQGSTSVNEDSINEVAVFSGINKIIRSDDFRGGKVTVVFGGGEIDLSQTKTKEKNINMEVTAVFGGAKITVPKDWKVVSRGTAILGGFDNKAEGEGNETILTLKGTAIFGGVEIVN